MRYYAHRPTGVPPGDCIGDSQRPRGEPRTRLTAGPHEVLDSTVLVGIQQMRVRFTQLLEGSTVELPEKHFAQVVQEDRRMAGQRADGFGCAASTDQRTRIQRVDVAVFAI